jgi:hypothetical protein
MWGAITPKLLELIQKNTLFLPKKNFIVHIKPCAKLHLAQSHPYAHKSLDCQSYDQSLVEHIIKEARRCLGT